MLPGFGTLRRPELSLSPWTTGLLTTHRLLKTRTFMMHLNFCLRVLSDCMQLVKSNAVGKSCTCDAWTTLAKLNRDLLPFKVLFCFSSTADQRVNELSIRKTSVGESFAALISSPLRALALACRMLSRSHSFQHLFSVFYDLCKGAVTPPRLL